MKVTGNQALSLLWLHYFGPADRLELQDKEVVHLKLELINQFDDLKKSPYVKQF